MPRLSTKVKRIMRVVGLVAIVMAGVLLYLSHLYLSSSTSHNATTLCLESIGNLTKAPQLNYGAIINLAKEYVRLYHVSMRVKVYALNGTLLFSYGSYVPPVINTGQSTPSIIRSGQVTIVSYGVCQYYGEDFIIEVQVGVMPEAIYSFIIGLVLLLLGLALIALGG